MASKTVDDGAGKALLVQAAHLFEEIATLAAQIDRVCYYSDPWGDDKDKVFLTLNLCRALAAQMGCLADVGSEKLDSGTAIKGGPEGWFMGPVYNEMTEVSHG